MKVEWNHRGRDVSRLAKQRALGVMVGAAVGDALGAPWEFRPRGLYRDAFPTRVLGGTGEMIGGGVFGWAPGEFTDDTQMGLALAEALLEAGGYDADTVWTWYRAWATTAADIGNATRRALRHDTWQAVPPDVNAAGNGTLMRSFPLALATWGLDDDVARDIVLHQAALTHQAPEAAWAAWIGVDMIRSSLDGHDMLDRLPAVVATLPDEVRATFAGVLSPAWDPYVDTRGNGHVVGCLAQAVWALRTTRSFADAVVAAIDLGDDADTVGCVTGALAGALYGVQTIPARWSTYVHGRVTGPTGERLYRIADLQEMALRLIGVKVHGESRLEEPAGPVEVAPGLWAADLGGAATVPTDWAVLSFARTGERFTGHPVRREYYLIDDEGDEQNPHLLFVVDDAVATIAAMLAEGRQVVVHCHGGRSRTGLVLKAWKMHTDRCSEQEAHEWLAQRWHRYQRYNQTFVDHLRVRETISRL